MMTHNLENQEIDEELMQGFFKFLERQGGDFVAVAFNLATRERTGTYFDTFKEATIIQYFGFFLLLEHKSVMDKIVFEQSSSIRDLLKLGLIKTSVELFKTH